MSLEGPRDRVLRHPASFRDPSGFVFERGGELFRQVNAAYSPHYDQLMSSRLYERLTEAGRLVPHEESPVHPAEPGGNGTAPARVLRPRRVPFISYPSEWCFSQLQDAALLTLAIERDAVEHGMTLKDASAFNIAFEGARPVFIDTLSFERYSAGEPWVAYGQFCRHFLAPLALASYRDIRLVQLLGRYLDGIPLDLAAGLLPRRTRLRFGLGVHLHLHARLEQRPATAAVPAGPRAGRGVSQRGMNGLIDSLESAIRGLRWRVPRTEWGDYYNDTNYSDAAMRHKLELVGRCIEDTRPASVWDLGANTGRFSRLASDRGIPTLALDIDPLAVERNYLDARERADRFLHPLWMDLTAPTPARGWDNAERDTLAARGPADMALALALVHHLAIGGNVPLPMIAGFMAGICRRLVIEWVPRHDSQVARLFVVRKDVFQDYNEDAFNRAFAAHFHLERRDEVAGTERALYVYRRRDD